MKCLLSVIDPLCELSFLNDFLDFMNILSELTDAVLVSRPFLGASPMQVSIPYWLLGVCGGG